MIGLHPIATDPAVAVLVEEVLLRTSTHCGVGYGHWGRPRIPGCESPSPNCSVLSCWHLNYDTFLRWLVLTHTQMLVPCGILHTSVLRHGFSPPVVTNGSCSNVRQGGGPCSLAGTERMAALDCAVSRPLATRVAPAPAESGRRSQLANGRYMISFKPPMYWG